MCFVGFQEQTAIICLYVNYQLVCVTQEKYVFSVRTGSANSDVRHPRCVLYNSKELSVVIHTVKHNYITSIITMGVLTTTCFGPTCGPSSDCN